MELNAGDIAAFEGRSKAIDRAGLDRLHWLGNYRRSLPTGLTRMMENAYDWEHLPYVHPSSFADIAMVEQGGWGWRCKVALPAGGDEQALELLVDRTRNYWATTVVRGYGAGVQIHTQAAEAESGQGIEIEVRFYLPRAPATQSQGAIILVALQAQYANLYDEDEALMTGRQAALDLRTPPSSMALEPGSDLGATGLMDKAQPTRVARAGGDIVVRWHGGRWIAHSAVCPHMLGPLDELPLDGGAIVCPWHGYRFSLADGREAQGRCGQLPTLRALEEIDGRLVAGSHSYLAGA